jgi:hypothetical protein
MACKTAFNAENISVEYGVLDHCSIVSLKPLIIEQVHDSTLCLLQGKRASEAKIYSIAYPWKVSNGLADYWRRSNFCGNALLLLQG